MKRLSAFDQRPMDDGLAESFLPEIPCVVDHAALVRDVDVAHPLRGAALERQAVTAEVADVKSPVEHRAPCAIDRTADDGERLLVQADGRARPIGAGHAAIFNDCNQIALRCVQARRAAPVVQLVLPRGALDRTNRRNLPERQKFNLNAAARELLRDSFCVRGDARIVRNDDLEPRRIPLSRERRQQIAQDRPTVDYRDDNAEKWSAQLARPPIAGITPSGGKLTLACVSVLCLMACAISTDRSPAKPSAIRRPVSPLVNATKSSNSSQNDWSAVDCHVFNRSRI